VIEGSDFKLLDELVPAAASHVATPTLSGAVSTAGEMVSLRDAKRSLVGDFERNYLIDALRASCGNIARAARSSGKPRRAFFELMRKYHLSASDYRRSAIAPCPSSESQ
jgi:transcriptional regulator of acetoin/glycerol metabolism